MKNLIVYFILFIIILTSTYAENITIEGKVIDKKRGISHSGIKVEIVSENNKSEIAITDISGYYYFENVKKGKYKLSINNNLIFENMEVKDENILLKDYLILSDKESRHTNIFSAFIFFMMSIISLFSIYFIKKIKKKYSRVMITSLFSFSIYFLLEVIRFAISVFNPKAASVIWIIPQIGVGFGIIFLGSFFIKYTRNNKKIYMNIIHIFLNLSIILSLGILTTWTYFGNDKKFKEYWGMYDYKIMIIYQIFIMVLFMFIILNLYINYKESKDKKEIQISLYLLKRFMFIFSMIIIFIFRLFLLKMQEPFHDYYGLIISALYMLFCWSILNSIFEIQFNKNYEILYKIFIKVFQYNIIFVAFLIIYNYYTMSKIQAILFVLILNLIIEIIFEKYANKKENYIQKIIKRLSVVDNLKDFEYIAAKEFEKYMDIQNIKFIYEDEVDIQKVNNYIEKKEKIVYKNVLKEILNKKYEYNMGLIIEVNNQFFVLIGIGEKIKENIVDYSDIENLKKIAVNIELLINNLKISEIKKKMYVNNKNETDIKKYKEIIMYTEKFIENIMKKNKDNKDENINELCEVLQEKINNTKRGKENE